VHPRPEHLGRRPQARREDEKLWNLALTDARIMADLSRAMSQDATATSAATTEGRAMGTLAHLAGQPIVRQPARPVCAPGRWSQASRAVAGNSGSASGCSARLPLAASQATYHLKPWRD
jgi:hypothetical protein